MSKYKQKRKKKALEESEVDSRLIKTLGITGALFLFIFIGYMGIWVIINYVLDISFILFTENEYSFTFVIFTCTSSALTFGLRANIRENQEKKKKLFINWIISEFIIVVFAIFVLAAYQW
ncbi:MAG: hypothetical protein EU541_02320 [Promethearchaeota archaeon]|nr:MAG: hypothetical protein EU541_02320 [Candidatus Lokiarchaeota archaeon]